jgi:hypothetical protein
MSDNTNLQVDRQMNVTMIGGIEFSNVYIYWKPVRNSCKLGENKESIKYNGLHDKKHYYLIIKDYPFTAPATTPLIIYFWLVR